MSNFVPETPGESIRLDIDSLALSGDGVGRHEGLVFFVDGALPGERVRVDVTKKEQNLIRARLLEILQSSPDRIQPVCPYFGRCGGCAFQHLAYERQLEVKQRELEQMFVHLGGFQEVNVEKILPSPKSYHYRNTVALSVRHQHDTPYLGFIEKDNRTFVPVEQCAIAEEKINRLLPHVKQRFKECVPLKKRYRTSQIVIRVGQGEEFYTSIKRHPESSWVLTAFASGRSFRYNGSSFFQTNPFLLDAFVGAVGSMLEPSQGTKLLDLYCGVGLFACCLAEGYGEVIGVEESEDAVSTAVDNAKANGVSRARFLAGRVEELVCGPEFSEGPFDIVVDPPRIGLKKEVIEALLRMRQIRRLVYVSCNPATLIRDLKLLSFCYDIGKVQPLDMFPQTKHLEVIVLLFPKADVPS